MRVKCLAQEHNRMSPARARTRTARSGVERTNHEATAPPKMEKKCKLNNTELFLKLVHIQSKEIGNNKYYDETTQLKNWQSEISLEY